VDHQNRGGEFKATTKKSEKEERRIRFKEKAKKMISFIC